MSLIAFKCSERGKLVAGSIMSSEEVLLIVHQSIISRSRRVIAISMSKSCEWYDPDPTEAMTAAKTESGHWRSGSSSIQVDRKQLVRNWFLHSTTPHTPSQWPQSSDAPLSAQLALSAPQASTRAPRTLPPTPAVKPTSRPSSRAPARTPSSTYVDNSSALSETPRKILRTNQKASMHIDHYTPLLCSV